MFLSGSPTKREARRDIHCKIHGRPVHAGGHIVYNWEARQCGRPTTRIYIDMKGGLGGRPYGVYMGSPTEREAR